MFSFQARWKEELIATAEGGSFMLELVGNPPIAYLPTETVWRNRVPDWAKELWPQLHTDLQVWCVGNGVGLAVDETARVY